MSLQTYRLFLEQADSQFERVHTAHESQFQCRAGCHSCCQAGLTVSAIERENIRAYLLAHPALMVQLASEKGAQTGCAFLDTEGRCRIYATRPFVCRSHGAPIAIAEEDYYRIDVCELNFKTLDIAELPPEDFFILDEWNSCLGSYGSVERYPLTPNGILQGEGIT